MCCVVLRYRTIRNNSHFLYHVIAVYVLDKIVIQYFMSSPHTLGFTVHTSANNGAMRKNQGDTDTFDKSLFFSLLVLFAHFK